MIEVSMTELGERATRYLLSEWSEWLVDPVDWITDDRDRDRTAEGRYRRPELQILLDLETEWGERGAQRELREWLGETEEVTQ